MKIYFAGTFGGFTSLIAFVPVELIKVRAQNNSQSKTIYREEIKKIYSKDGIRGLYRGFSANFMRDCPTMGVYFLSYNLI